MAYCLRCTVSGGLEDFAQAEVIKHVVASSSDIDVEFHHRGNSGSLLDIRCHQSRETFLHDTLLRVVKNLRYVDHVALQVLSLDVPSPSNDDDDDDLLDWITSCCLEKLKEQGSLETAIEAWKIWKSILDKAMSVNDIEGELIATPELVENSSQEKNTADESPTRIQTDSFQVNTIYTKPAVAKIVVRTFMRLVHKELENDNDEIMWIDAGAGSGVLLKELPKDSSIGVDLDPCDESVYKRDFFDVSLEWLQSLSNTGDGRIMSPRTICLISNPPFTEGTRGDYAIIAKFIQHAMHQLKARMMGLIVPIKFAHAWKSFGLPIRLLYRMHLPKNPFYDPSTADSKHLQCYLLVFDLQPKQPTNTAQPMETNNNDPDEQLPHIHVVAQRDKGLFPTISTATLTSAVVNGLGRGGVLLGSSQTSSIKLKAKLAKRLELFVELNPKRPLSLVNSMSSRVENHSLGWMSKSVKPPIAWAMHSLCQTGTHPNPTGTMATMNISHSQQQRPTIIVDLLCGEGTLEYESMGQSSDNSCFHIVGDKSEDAVKQAAAQMSSSSSFSGGPPMDFVIWDAQHLPLRKGIADAVLADLPFTGSSTKNHQVPATAKDPLVPSASLSYPMVLASTTRVLAPSGRAVMVSADSKALTHGAWKYAGNLQELWQTKLNIGGITGKLLVLRRKGPFWKDVNFLVERSGVDHTAAISMRARKVCTQFYMDELLELQSNKDTPTGRNQGLLTHVQLRDEYRHTDQSLSQCYRLCFDPIINNAQAKILEKAVRLDLDANPLDGARLA